MGDGVGAGVRVACVIRVVATTVAGGARVGLGVVNGFRLAAAGDEPAGFGVVGVLPHAARITPRRRDAARRFAFICRRCCCCGLSRR
jgi:hypothetical protein